MKTGLIAEKLTKNRVPAKFSKNYAAGSCGAKIEKASPDVTVSLFAIQIKKLCEFDSCESVREALGI